MIIANKNDESNNKIVDTILNLQLKDTLFSQTIILKELILQNSLIITNDNI